MAHRHCRDCPACTRSTAGRAAWWWGTAFMGPMIAMFVRPFVKSCPECGHMLGRHERRRDGAFVD